VEEVDVPSGKGARVGNQRRTGDVLRGAIRAAVVELLLDHGVAGVTMQAVAVRAGTSKPVLYRRWPSRTALLRDTLVPLAMDAIPHADTGSYAGDMHAILHGWAELFRSPRGAIFPAIVGAIPHDPELAQAFRDGVIGWRKEEMAKTIARGIARGEVRADVPVDIARELGQAMLWHRFLITGDTIEPDFVDRVLREVLLPFVAPAAHGDQERGITVPPGRR